MTDPLAIDVAHLEHQREWSRATFGPHQRTAGVLDHVRKELDEIAADPSDVEEWADLVILAFDGAWRAGHEPADTLAAIKAKQAKNETREWPDWRTADPDKAIEHVRGDEPRPARRMTVGDLTARHLGGPVRVYRHEGVLMRLPALTMDGWVVWLLDTATNPPEPFVVVCQPDGLAAPCEVAE